MARYGARVRTVVFLDADTIAKCNDLGARYRASRSEVLRISVELGLKEVRPALRRLQRLRATATSLPVVAGRRRRLRPRVRRLFFPGPRISSSWRTATRSSR